MSLYFKPLRFFLRLSAAHTGALLRPPQQADRRRTRSPEDVARPVGWQEALGVPAAASRLGSEQFDHEPSVTRCWAQDQKTASLGELLEGTGCCNPIVWGRRSCGVVVELRTSAYTSTTSPSAATITATSSPASSFATTRLRSRVSSSWAGSWWVSTSRSTPASRATSTQSLMVE